MLGAVKWTHDPIKKISDKLVSSLSLARLHTYVGGASTLITLGYVLSIDRPLSYVPYGLCRTFEGFSETFPSFRQKRLAIFVRISCLAERWVSSKENLESPFLNAYLLDRVCREFSLNKRTLQEGSVKRADTATVQLIGPSSACMENPQVERIVSGAPAANRTHAPPEVQKPVEFEPPLSSASYSLEKWSQRARLIVKHETNQLLDVVKEWSTAWRSSDLLRFNQSFPLLIRSRVGREPLAVAALDRVHHLTCSLDAECNDVTRLSSVYVPVIHFLNQWTLHYALKGRPDIKGRDLQDAKLLQFLHLSLLATHRIMYWTWYERIAVLPAPPALLPLGDECLTDSLCRRRSAWSSYREGTDQALSLIKSFSPKAGHTSPGTLALEAKLHSPPDGFPQPHFQPQRKPVFIGTREAQILAGECQKKLQAVWNAVSSSKPFCEAAQSVVWHEDLDSEKTSDMLGHACQLRKSIWRKKKRCVKSKTFSCFMLWECVLSIAPSGSSSTCNTVSSTYVAFPKREFRKFRRLNSGREASLPSPSCKTEDRGTISTTCLYDNQRQATGFFSSTCDASSLTDYFKKLLCASSTAFLLGMTAMATLCHLHTTWGLFHNCNLDGTAGKWLYKLCFFWKPQQRPPTGNHSSSTSLADNIPILEKSSEGYHGISPVDYRFDSTVDAFTHIPTSDVDYYGASHLPSLYPPPIDLYGGVPPPYINSIPDPSNGSGFLGAAAPGAAYYPPSQTHPPMELLNVWQEHLQSSTDKSFVGDISASAAGLPV